VVHTFTTVATGGFSPKTASIGFYDSVAIEAVLIAFMKLSGVSFSLYYLLYTQRRFDTILDREFLAYTTLIVVAIFSYGAYWSSRAITATPRSGHSEIRRSP
jgi:trk/ktr system potassium uptake protein